MALPPSVKFVIGVLVAISIAALGGGLVFAIGNNGLLAFQLLGTFVIYLSGRPSRAECAVTLALATALRTTYGAIWGFQTYFGSSIICCFSFLGLASLLVLLVQTVRATSPELRRARWSTFLTAGAFPYLWIFLAFSLARVANTPRTYDPLLLAFDTSLGPSISFIFGKVLLAHPVLRDCTQTVYGAIGLAASCVLAWYHQSRWRPVKALPLYVTTMVLGYTIYWIYPAAGPAPAYQSQFPLWIPDKWQILSMPLTPFTAPRNAMPSLHFGAMLLLMWNARPWPAALRIAAALFASAVAFSTLALGEHYLIDLVVAFPFMMSIQSMWSTAVPLQDPCRYRPLIAGFLLTAAWLTALRYAIPAFLSSPFVGWVSMLSTVAATVTLETRLARLTFSSERQRVPARSPITIDPSGTIEACPHFPSPRRAAP
jgi:hypothetical protein